MSEELSLALKRASLQPTSIWEKKPGHVDPSYNHSAIQDLAVPKMGVGRSSSLSMLPDIATKNREQARELKTDTTYVARIFEESKNVATKKPAHEVSVKRTRFDAAVGRKAAPCNTEVRNYLTDARTRRKEGKPIDQAREASEYAGELGSVRSSVLKDDLLVKAARYYLEKHFSNEGTPQEDPYEQQLSPHGHRSEVASDY